MTLRYGREDGLTLHAREYGLHVRGLYGDYESVLLAGMLARIL
jgi:hypothetical protein